jgi:hypothetical protein
VFLPIICFFALQGDETKLLSEGSGAQAIEHQLHCGLWRVDGGFVSTIRIKNSLIVAPLEVRAVLYMADGTAYPLPAVHLPISGVATVNVNAALAAAPPQIAGHLSTHGSAAVFYTYPTPGHLLGSIEVLDLAGSLIFTYPFIGGIEGEAGPQTIDGLWWRHDPGVGGFVSLANTTAEPIEVSLQVSGSSGRPQPAVGVQLLAHGSSLVDLDRLVEQLPGLENGAGGVRIRYAGREGDVIISGGLVNERIGYSANLPFHRRRDHHEGGNSRITYAGVGVMVGEADIAAGFPGGTRFAPYAALRNMTPNPLLVRLGVNYMKGPQPVTRTLPAVPLAPFETRYLNSEQFDIAALSGFSGMINLTASFEGRAGDLLLAMGSVDGSGSYVLAVEPQGLGRSFSKEGHYWTVADGFDTMFTLWNPTEQGQKFVVTFFFGSERGQYKLPVRLGRNASATIDVGKIIAAQQPDEDGNIIPFGTREGSVVFSSAQGMTDWMTLAIGIGILNAHAGTCGSYCVSCCGYTAFSVTPSPAYCPLGLTAQCGAQATYCSGWVYSFTNSSSWSSSNTSILTVNNTTQKGLVTGVGPGTATVSALFPSVIVFTGTICSENAIACPTSVPAATGPVTVQKPASLSVVSTGTTTPPSY